MKHAITIFAGLRLAPLPALPAAEARPKIIYLLRIRSLPKLSKGLIPAPSSS